MRYLRVVRGRKANAGGPWNAVGCKLWRVSFLKRKEEKAFHHPIPQSLSILLRSLTPEL